MEDNSIPKVNVDEKLGLLEYQSDQQTHIAIRDDGVCWNKCQNRPCLFICPAKVYEWDESRHKIIVSFENCIECGACRMLCPFGNIDCHWPRGGFGVKYRYG